MARFTDSAKRTLSSGDPREDEVGSRGEGINSNRRSWQEPSLIGAPGD